MNKQSLSLTRYYLHFAWMHTCASLALVGLVSLYEQWSGNPGSGNLGGAVAVLIASAYFVAHKFVAREGRAPEGGEVHRLVWVSLALSVAWSCLFLLVTFLLIFGGDVLFGLELLLSEVPPAFLIFLAAAALVGAALSVGLFYLIYGRAARKIANRRPARAVG